MRVQSQDGIVRLRVGAQAGEADADRSDRGAGGHAGTPPWAAMIDERKQVTLACPPAGASLYAVPRADAVTECSSAW